MITTRVTVRIRRPVDEVFAFVTDPANFPRWAGALVTAARQTSPGPMRAGATFHQTNKFLIQRFQTEFVVTVYEPPRRFEYRSTAGPIQYFGHYTITNEGDVVRFTSVDDSQPGGLLRLLAPLLQPLAQRQIETNLGNVKRILETAPPGRAR
jgi:uncharacterized protein YndB with AHSA1/START domain